jgi:hypothetical protein
MEPYPYAISCRNFDDDERALKGKKSKGMRRYRAGIKRKVIAGEGGERVSV